MSNLQGRPLADARLLKFRTGRSRQVWNKNVIAVGQSAGFLEPLEATTIHIILSTLNKIITYFPPGISMPARSGNSIKPSSWNSKRSRTF